MSALDDEKYNYDDKTPSTQIQVVPVLDDERHMAAGDDVLVDVHTGVTDGVQRKMKQRHMQMM